MILRSVIVVSAVLLTALLPARAQAPYAVRTEQGWEQCSLPDANHAVRTPIKIGDTLIVPAVGKLPALAVQLREAVAVAPDQLAWPEHAPVFVMADSHGQYEIAVELLRKQGVINTALQWCFGRGWLVVTGDVFDRGPNHTEIFWLLYQLEAEAKKAGGRVCVLLGNHETMNLLGDLRYLHPKYLQEAKALGVASYTDLWSKDTLLGQWLRTKPAVLKIGRTLFLHGGISPDAAEAKWTISEMNRVVRARLNGELSKESPEVAFIFGPVGPLWFRGYFPNIPKLAQATPDQVRTVCTAYDVSRIAVGHTIVDTVTPLYNGSVIAVQVYPTKDSATGQMNMEGVCIDEHGVWHKAKIDGTREPLRNDKGEVIRNSEPAAPLPKAA